MSTTSRLRQTSPKPPASRSKKRAPYKRSPFNVTAFQKQAHDSLVRASKKERDDKAGEYGVRIARQREDAKRRVKNWPSWIRDGFESEVHYEVHHNRAGLVAALRSGDASHPLLPVALEASRLNLIKI